MTTMPVRRIRGSWWVDIRDQGTRHRKRSPLNTKAGAKAYELTLRARLARGEEINVKPAAERKSDPTLADFAERWLSTYAAANNKASERYAKAGILRRHLLPYFDGLCLREVSTETIEAYKTYKLAGGLAAKTVNNHLAVLSKCLGTAVDWCELDSTPRVRLLRSCSQRIDFLTPQEVERVIQDRREPIWNALVRMAVRTGMRPGELSALEWNDVDLVGGIVTVRQARWRDVVDAPKTHRVRHLPVAEDLRAALVALPRSCKLVFAREDGRHLSDGMREKALQRMAKRTGVRAFTVYTLRHTFASHLVMAGVPLPVVQQLMGHATIAMTMRYAHVAPSALTAAARALEGVCAWQQLQVFGQPAGNHERNVTPDPLRAPALAA